MRFHLAVIVTSALLASGCFLDRAPLSGSSPTDAGHELDAMVRLDGGSTPVDGGRADAEVDAQIPRDSGPGDSGPGDSGPRDAGCSPVGTTCTGGELVSCAADGILSRRTCDFGCASTGDRCARPLPSNVGPTFVSDTAGPLVLSGTFDTTGCPGGTPVPQTSGPALCVLSASTVDVPSSLLVTGDEPLVIVASGAVTIEGDIDVSARGTTPGPGGANGGVRASTDGEGLSPGIHGGTSSNNADGGGGGGGLCGAGGNGGTGQSTAGGAGGAAVSGWDLSPLRGGSGGGWARGASGTYDTSAAGGAGGGALQIFSAVSIALDATIFAGGGGGRPGLRHPDPSVNYGAGGGGGSGGAVLLEAPMVTFGGSARITTTGGGGGGAASDGGDGDPGEDGADASGRADGGSSGGSRYGAAGGRSGANDTPNGRNGEDNTGGNANGGGGGGGVGCILVRTLDGTLPSGTGAFSPSVPDGLRSAMLRIE